jgi:hypothetical protein
MSRDFDEVIRQERRLLDPDVRRSRDVVDALLHADFVEFGASGRVWHRAAIVAALAADPQVIGEAVDFEATALGDDVVLVTYRIIGAGGSLRSSVWMREAGHGWRLRFHQGTRLAWTAEP